MRIAKLEIHNYRGVSKGTIKFKRHPVLIGGNNAGKTTVIEALTLLFGRDKLLRELTEHDFYGSCPKPEDRIKLIGTITDFPGNDPEQNSDWFRDGRAVPKWLDEESGMVHSTRQNDDWLLCCQIGVQAHFDSESLAVELVRYFHDHDQPMDPFADDAPTGVPPGLVQKLGFYLVRASRTWDKVFSWGSELFKRTIKAAAAQPSAAIIAERDRLRNPDQPIDQDPQIKPLIDNVNSEIARCFSDTPEIQLRLTSTDSRAVMDAVAAHFSIAGGPSLPAARQGSGLVSMQGLMLLLELGRVRAEAGDGFVMALEEPELHLPPAAQQQLVQRVQALSTQTILTTHSPLIAAMSEPTSVIVLRNQGGKLCAEPFLEEALKPDAENWRRKFFQHSRVEVLSAVMQPAILVPEGKGDYHLFKAILKPLMLTEGWASSMPRVFAIEVGVVPTEDAKVVDTYRALSRIHRKVCCLVDGDVEGVIYVGQLLKLAPPPVSVIRWHDGAMIEDIVGWIMQGGEGAVMGALGKNFPPAPATCAELVALMKQKKMDVVMYEAISEAIASTPTCRARAASLFEGLANACLGEPTARFAKDAAGVLVFVP
jgi:putative ATP-dependent endonuclease of the OLD family